jgi:flagellar hook-basal body complex protein FliE
MNIGYVPKLSLDGVKNPFQANMTGMMQKLDTAANADQPNFKDALASLTENINSTVTAPDAMMHDAMTTGTVDVHDLMIANAKAELLVSVSTQVATKVVQAYDKILQIQL